MKRLLIATDGSPAAEAAVAAGVELADLHEAAVVFLRVVEPIDVRVLSPRFARVEVFGHALADPEQDEALEHAAAVAEAHGVEYDLRLVSGLTVETIIDTADEIDAELIAVGSNRHGAVATAFFGSVSTELLKRCRRPVLVVHPTPARLYAEVGA
jgi:nucleotide-binding universal stress UspA family protein